MKYKTMSKISYTIATNRPNADFGVYDYSQQLGYYAFEIWGFHFGVGKNNSLWTVTDLISGRSVTTEPTRTKAVKVAREILEEVGEDRLAELISHAVQLTMA